MHKLLIAALLGCAASFSALPAQAAFSDFMTATCGPTCKDAVGEQRSASENWKALEKMGTTSYVGATVGEFQIDASSLLAAARQVGPVEIDRWLRTGEASSSFAAEDIMSALSSVSGIDLSRITGNKFGANLGGSEEDGVDVLEAFTTASNSKLLGPGLGGGAYCDQNIDSALNASAQNYVNGVVAAAEDSEMGFSQAGGGSIGDNSHSDSGLFGGSCLDMFMTGDRDTLFRPPQLSQLVSMMSSMFGAEAEGNCANAPTVHEQVANSTPNAAFMPGNGGFFPGHEYGGLEGGMVQRDAQDPYGFLAKGERQGGMTSDLASLF